MCFSNVVREVREDMDLTQKDIAFNIGVSQAMWSKYESGKTPMPNDIANRLIKTLKNPRIRAEYVFQERGEFFNVPLLNNVDDNPIVVLDSLKEESQELVNHCRELKKLLRNKRSRQDITDEDWGKVMDCEEQIADILPALKLHFVKMIEDFDLDLEYLERRIQAKLKFKKYIK